MGAKKGRTELGDEAAADLLRTGRFHSASFPGSSPALLAVGSATFSVAEILCADTAQLLLLHLKLPLPERHSQAEENCTVEHHGSPE